MAPVLIIWPSPPKSWDSTGVADSSDVVTMRTGPGRGTENQSPSRSQRNALRGVAANGVAHSRELFGSNESGGQVPMPSHTNSAEPQPNHTTPFIEFHCWQSPTPQLDSSFEQDGPQRPSKGVRRRRWSEPGLR